MKNGEAGVAASTMAGLPSVDELLRGTAGKRVIQDVGAAHAAALARAVIEQIRGEIRDENSGRSGKEQLKAEAESRLEEAWQSELKTRIRRVINATGVIIHTNLGRAPLSDEAKKAVADNA